jgi:hypothetical protein
MAPLRCLQWDEVPDPGEERGLMIHEGLAEVVGPGRGDDRVELDVLAAKLPR